MTVVVDEMTTPGGAEVVVVHYDGGHQEMMPRKTYELVATNTVADFTTIRDKKFDAILHELYPIIGEYLVNFSKKETTKGIARTELLQKTMATLQEYDAKAAETEVLLNSIEAEVTGIINAMSFEIDNIFNRATNFLWTGDDKQFIPGVNAMMECTLLGARKVTSKIPVPEVPKNETEPSTTE